jgi:hypothetical protein
MALQIAEFSSLLALRPETDTRICPTDRRLGEKHSIRIFVTPLPQGRLTGEVEPE